MSQLSLNSYNKFSIRK